MALTARNVRLSNLLINFYLYICCFAKSEDRTAFRSSAMAYFVIKIYMNSETQCTVSFCRAMLCIARLLPACGVRLSVCPSVRPSVTFVSCAKMNKDIFEIFSTW